MAGSTYDQAMDKIRDEMAKNPENAGINALGEHMTVLLQGDSSIAAQILTDGKTLSGAFRALEAHARKQAKGKGCVVISDAEGFGIAESYYGIHRTQESTPEIPQALQEAATAADPFDLDSLLGL